MSKKVALMCGHGTSTDGSWDPGTVYAGNSEAALMLPITKAAVKYLRSYGVTVISDADTNNNKNMIADVAWANKWGADVYISVHCDWYKAGTGVMPLYVSSEGKKLATALNTAVKNSLGMKSRGVIRRTDLYELNKTDAIACILETGSIKADISIFKNKVDAYGKAIAKGICDYIGHKIPAAPAPTPQKVETLYRVRKTWADSKSQIGAYKSLDNAKAECDKHPGYSVFDPNGKAVYTKAAAPATIYRVRKSWKDPKTQVGAYKSLANAKAECDKHPGYSVYGTNGKLLYTSKVPEKTIADKIIEACVTQAKWMKNFTYKWESNPTIAKSAKKGTCVTYVACVLQRVGLVTSGKYIWHNGKGYGTGKVYGDTAKFKVTYMNNKTFAQLKGTLQKGDVVLCDDNKSGEKGSGGHVMIFSGSWASNGNPYVYDQNSATYAKQGKSLLRSYSKSHKVLAICRAK